MTLHPRGAAAPPTSPSAFSVRESRGESARIAIGRARSAQAAWGALSAAERAATIRPAKSRILDRAEKIAHVIHTEIGKPEIEALLGEVLPSADVVQYWADVISDLLEPSDVSLDPIAYPRKNGIILREPRGVIAVVGPYNFPLALPLRTIVPALLAGNAVVFKPSEVSPQSGALVGEIFEGLLPGGVLQVLQGAGDVGEALVSGGVDFVSFTGSVATGRKVAHACAERLIPCALELGGKDAAIVLADCDIERAAQGIAWGGLMNAGQNCASVERVYVEQAIAAPFVDRLSEIVRSLRPGIDVARLATASQCRLVDEQTSEARSSGARIVAGGHPGADGLTFEPTVVAVENDDLALMRDETFGPVIAVSTVADADEAVRRANAGRFGLTASVWTRDLERGVRLARQLRAGVVTVNNHAFTGALPAAPWSGVGESGYGVTNSPLSLEGLTRPRFLLVDAARTKRELWWFPYTPTLRTIGLSFAVLRSKTSGILAKLRALVSLARALPKRLRGE